ncbi:MAG TPA: hypothetical protein VJ751_06220 [Pyrinomonadaceae bacterium]|nr:hypothetical protein [Pyrinomonadaceae bacterium]
MLYSAHAYKETNKNSHLITQESSNFSSQESFGCLGNFDSLKKGVVKSAHIDDQEYTQEKEAERTGMAKAARNDPENVPNGLRE